MVRALVFDMNRPYVYVTIYLRDQRQEGQF